MKKYIHKKISEIRNSFLKLEDIVYIVTISISLQEAVTINQVLCNNFTLLLR